MVGLLRWFCINVQTIFLEGFEDEQLGAAPQVRCAKSLEIHFALQKDLHFMLFRVYYRRLALRSQLARP